MKLATPNKTCRIDRVKHLCLIPVSLQQLSASAH
jgi:hypothetical protein